MSILWLHTVVDIFMPSHEHLEQILIKLTDWEYSLMTSLDSGGQRSRSKQAVEVAKASMSTLVYLLVMDV